MYMDVGSGDHNEKPSRLGQRYKNEYVKTEFLLHILNLTVDSITKYPIAHYTMYIYHNDQFLTCELSSIKCCILDFY